MFGAGKFCLRIDFPGKRLEYFAFRSITNDDQTRSRAKLSASPEQRADPLPNLEPANEEDRRAIHGPRSVVRDRGWRRGDRIMGDEDFLPRKTQCGVFLGPALAVCDYPIELADKRKPPLLSKSTDRR